MATEGKTKRVSEFKGAILESKDDLTAGDGKKHDVLPGKGALANRTTCNVFQLLKRCGGLGLRIAYLAKLSDTTFIGYHCLMIPIEVVVRREAHGSYLKRNPDVPKGTKFEKPIVEMYLKTKDRKFRQYEGFPCDDPMMKLVGFDVELYEPSRPLSGQQPFAKIPLSEIFDPWDNEYETLHTMADMAVWAFLILEVAWKKLGRTLADFKVEFGIYGPEWFAVPTLADVIDNDSWRLLSPEGKYEDKQGYRDGDNLAAVFENYQRVALMTDRFAELENEIKEETKDIPRILVHTAAFTRAY